MQLLLGLFFFSILLTTGSSMQCVNCLAINGYCADVKEKCPSENHVCMSLVMTFHDKTYQVIVKRCATKDDCNLYKDQKDKLLPKRIDGVPDGSIIKEVTCSKAPPSFASFFPAFLGLLLMKLLF